MPLDKTETWQKLNRLDWTRGLTKEQIILDLHEANRQLDEELYHHLPANKKFYSAREVIDFLPNSVWSGIGDRLHEEQKVLGPRVTTERAARGTTSLKQQTERTRRRHLDEKGD